MIQPTLRRPEQRQRRIKEKPKVKKAAKKKPLWRVG
jgi:hypothetical protein